jgi:YHS domain-containing protein
VVDECKIKSTRNDTFLKGEGTKMAKDPVCKMEVDEKTAPATSEYKGKTYYFCAIGCKKAFDANPEKYAGQ